MDEETIVWEGSPSQIINLPIYLLCGLGVGILLGGAMLAAGRVSPLAAYALAGAAIVPLLIGLAQWLRTWCQRYAITTERIRIRQGVLSRKTDAVELYRVKDYVLLEPLALRFFGLSHLVLKTDDDVNPTVVLRAIPRAPALQDQIRKHVEICRDKKGVRITEFEG
jgi:uncharacterized membrane protein YdbT with pleckstrin-like domain